MRNYRILLLAFSFFFTTEMQAQIVYARITDNAGNVLRGEVLTRGYERQFQLFNFPGVTSMDPQVRFSLSTQPSTATLQNIQQAKSMLGSVFITVFRNKSSDQAMSINYTILLQNVRILELVNSVNGGVTLTNLLLQAEKIGTTYYEPLRGGGIRVSSKTGYDFLNRQPWTGF